jgi:putative sterol carrier protein
MSNYLGATAGLAFPLLCSYQGRYDYSFEITLLAASVTQKQVQVNHQGRSRSTYPREDLSKISLYSGSLCEVSYNQHREPLYDRWLEHEEGFVIAAETIEELRKRFKPENARNLSATYLITISGKDGGAWLTKISEGKCEFIEHDRTKDSDGTAPADCMISVDAEDLELIMTGKLSAMTAALSGILAIEGELGLAMQLVPIFFEGQAPFI